VQRDERVAEKFKRECRHARLRLIKGKCECGRVRLKENVRDSHFTSKVGTLAGMARILMRAEVVPGPAVQRPRAHARRVIRNEVITQSVALVGRAPYIGAFGVYGKCDAIADAGCKYPRRLFAFDIECQHVRPIGLPTPGRAESVPAFPTANLRRRFLRLGLVTNPDQLENAVILRRQRRLAFGTDS
jgi:hypothetical protein